MLNTNYIVPTLNNGIVPTLTNGIVSTFLINHNSYRESVTNLQHMLGRSTWEELISKRKRNFTERFVNLPDDSLVHTV